MQDQVCAAEVLTVVGSAIDDLQEPTQPVNVSPSLSLIGFTNRFLPSSTMQDVYEYVLLEPIRAP